MLYLSSIDCILQNCFTASIIPNKDIGAVTPGGK
jgi:hypothetical protein